MTKWKFLGWLLLPTIFMISCKSKEAQPAGDTSDYSYFSIKQFIEDQYYLKKGQPYLFKKVVTLNGKSDTSSVPYNQVDWKSIFEIFGKTDISNPKFYGKYDFNNVDDNILESSMLIYTAKSPDLFVQKLNVAYDNENGKVSMIYIETLDEGKIATKQQYLSYYVNQKIVIHEVEKTMLSPEKDITVTYLFP